jgi:alkylation response protein AidB-like acyl-CoA dehydrogenase
MSDKSFAEVALESAGKSKEEAQSVGKIDKADDQVEVFFKHNTSASPIHKAVWDRKFPEEFSDTGNDLSDDREEELSLLAEKCCKLIYDTKHNTPDYFYNRQGKITDKFLKDLGEHGYWGLLISKEYGGKGLTVEQFTRFLTQIATVDPTTAGLASVHGCIGAVDPIRTFGNEEQKQQYLPKLADGTKLSGFALTEPNAGSDLTALRTTAVLEGDNYIVNGEKLFITNAKVGRTVGLVAMIDGKPAVLVVDLPKGQGKDFEIKSYKIHALKHTNNVGLVFKDFKVPKRNLLVPPSGDGLTIAYHGLNHGRVSLCANAAGVMRKFLADMVPWARYRETYGQQIVKRELVQRRMAVLASYIVGADAMVQWCSRLIDQGYRGEMECIIAKIFGSEMQKEAAVELYMKTHGGRSFLGGHFFGDNMGEFLAPCIYEGEGEMLSMALFKSLVKEHGKEYFEPIAKTLMELGVKKPNFLNPKHLWALKGPMLKYAAWVIKENLFPRGQGGYLTAAITYEVEAPFGKATPIERTLGEHYSWARDELQKTGYDISSVMVKYQMGLADRQCRISQISDRVQKLIVMAVTASYGVNSGDAGTETAANILCSNLRNEIQGKKTSDSLYREHMDFAKMIEEGEFKQIEGIKADPILMDYRK